MSDQHDIETFLERIKSEGRSSPAGIHWHKFYEHLQSRKLPGSVDPPVPMILAASGESNASKHHRLSQQLQWALQNECLGDAITYLEELGADCWNLGTEDRWFEESYWKP